MNALHAFHFLRPWWLLALPPLTALLLVLWHRRRHSRSWQAVCDPALLPHLLLGRDRQRGRGGLALLLTGLLLAVLALAGPTWQRRPQPLFRSQSALVILFDLSRSMQAADLKPSRYLRARLKLEDLLRQRREGQTALIAFAGDAFAVTPLTDDAQTITALLKTLTPELMPVQGSAPERAMALGEKLLRQAGLRHGRLLLVTDEDRTEPLLDAARAVRRQGFELAVIGVGTPEGAPIPQPAGGFFKDAAGNLVLPKLNEAGLQQLAAAGGGVYHRLSVDDGDLHAVLAGLGSHRLDRAGGRTGLSGDTWRDAGVWLLWPLALLAALAFRRGWLLVLPLLLLQPHPAAAFSWHDLWQRPDQRAASAFAHGDYAGAAKQFRDPRWQAGARYRAGDYAGAAKALAHPTTADDWYNRGNALARSGDLGGALKAYDQALSRDPHHADAQANKGVVEKALRRQRKQQKKGQKGQKGQEGQKGQKGQRNQQHQHQHQQQQQQQQQQEQHQQQQQQEQHQQQQEQQKQQQGQKGRQSQQRQAQRQKSRQQQPPPTTGAEASKETKQQRAARQWLQQIPDDPGGLLRRKFLYQYRQRGEQRETDRPW